MYACPCRKYGTYISLLHITKAYQSTYSVITVVLEQIGTPKHLVCPIELLDICIATKSSETPSTWELNRMSPLTIAYCAGV